MSGEINRVPVGLLSLLDMKARGQSPRMLSGEVSSSLEILQLYLQNDRRLIRQSVTAALGVRQAVVFTVPQQQFWLVHGLHTSSGTLAAGSSTRLVGCLTRVDQTSAVANTLPLGTSEAFLTGQQIVWGKTWDTPYYALPNDIFGFFCSEFTLGGGAATLNCTLDYTPVNI